MGGSSFVGLVRLRKSLDWRAPRNRTLHGALVGLAEAAADQQLFTREPPGVVGSQEHCDRGDIARLTEAAKRSLSDQSLLKVSTQKTGALHAFCFDHAGIESVDPDLLWSQLTSEHAGDGVDGAFGTGVDGRCRRGDAAYD